MEIFNVSFQTQMETKGKDQLYQGASVVLGGEYECGVNAHHIQILDIGGNIGAFTLWALHRFPFSTVQVFEPVPEVFSILEENLKFYKSMVLSFPLAVSVEPSLILTVDPNKLENTGKYSGRFYSNKDSYTVRVETIHPRDIWPVDIVKVDCEGYEEEVITNLSLEETSLIIVEFHSDLQRRNVEFFLYEKGFTLHWTRPSPFYGLSGICFYWKETDKSEIYLSHFNKPGGFSI
jgi:FkbM family methyltransferase